MRDVVCNFIEELTAIKLDNVFNPYSDCCPTYDLENAAAIRRRNLESSLRAALKLNVETIWVARDLGYRGGRRTGLALTDEIHLNAYADLFCGLKVERATKGAPIGERTANVIWQMLRLIHKPIFLWNVFPLHPHEEENQMTNRSHTAGERDIGGWFLSELIQILEPKMVIAIGGDAHKAAKKFNVDSIKVRHPSYGGKSDFIHQVSNAYKLNSGDGPLLYRQ